MAEKNVILKNTAGDVLYPEVAVKNRVVMIDAPINPNVEAGAGNYGVSINFGNEDTQKENYDSLYNQVKNGGQAFFHVTLDGEIFNVPIRISEDDAEPEMYGTFTHDAYYFIPPDTEDGNYTLSKDKVPTVFTINTILNDDLYPGWNVDAEQIKISSNQINDKAVTTAKIADGSVTTDKIAAGAVTTDKIVDKTVTTVKLGDDVNNTINGKEDKTPINNVTATAGGTVTLTANSFTNITMPTTGGAVTIAITASSDTTNTSDYDGSITIGTTVPTITWDSKVKWQSDAPTLEATVRDMNSQ